MNFNIIDGNDDYLNKLPAFVEAYNSNKLSIPELQQELNITNSEYRKLRKAGIEENLITLKRRGRKKKRTYKTNPKHYGKTMTKGIHYWRVYRKETYYCNVKTEAQAKEIVRRLEACNWDKSQAARIKEEVISELQ